MMMFWFGLIVGFGLACFLIIVLAVIMYLQEKRNEQTRKSIMAVENLTTTAREILDSEGRETTHERETTH